VFKRNPWSDVENPRSKGEYSPPIGENTVIDISYCNNREKNSLSSYSFECMMACSENKT
jgi:hypothetical protein